MADIAHGTPVVQKHGSSSIRAETDILYIRLSGCNLTSGSNKSDMTDFEFSAHAYLDVT